jgi:hypothetical protein
VKKIFIFGSSVTPLCNPTSDVDVYFVLEKKGKWPSVVNHSIAFDKWDNFTAGPELKSEIMKKGVLVYER